MTRPVIGVTTSSRRGRFMWWFNKVSLWLAGAKPRRITPANNPFDMDAFDGFVLGGGDDISADLYGGELELSVRIDPDRDALERRVLDAALSAGLPVLGVCRGAQMINVFLGGSLHQDIYRAYEGVPRMRTPLPRKTVDLDPGSHLFRIMYRLRFRVNSLHSQSIQRLGKGLAAVAHDEYGIIQAIEDNGRDFLVGVQWHPEFLFWIGRHARLFRALTAAARRSD